MSVTTQPVHINLLHKNAIHEIEAYPDWTMHELYNSIPDIVGTSDLMEISFTEKTLKRNEEIETYIENKIEVLDGNLFNIADQLEEIQTKFDTQDVSLRYQSDTNQLYFVVPEKKSRSLCLFDVGIEGGETVLFEVDEKPFCRIIFEGQLDYLALEEIFEKKKEEEENIFLADKEKIDKVDLNSDEKNKIIVNGDMDHLEKNNLLNLRKANSNIPERFAVFKNGEEIQNVEEILDGDTLEIISLDFEFSVYCGRDLQKIQIPFHPNLTCGMFKTKCIQQFIDFSMEDPTSFKFFANSEELKIENEDELLSSFNVTPQTLIMFFDISTRNVKKDEIIVFIKIKETTELIDLKIKPDASILRIKFNIEKKLENYPFENQKLTFNEIQLRNDWDLTNYDIKQFDIFNLELKINNKDNNFFHDRKQNAIPQINKINKSENNNDQKITKGYDFHFSEELDLSWNIIPSLKKKKIFVTLNDFEVVDIPLTEYVSRRGLKAYLKRYEAEKKISGIPYMNWSIVEVCAWLTSLGLDQYCEKFCEVNVEGNFLPFLLQQQDIFDAMCIKNRHRMTLKQSIHQLIQKYANFET